MTTPTKLVKKHRSPKQKLETVQLYLMFGGSVLKTSQALKIPEQTIWQWKRTDWWHEMEQSIKEQENLELSARLKRVANKSIALVEDRLEHGDWIYDQKSGEMRRKPVALRDVHKVAVDSLTKRAELEQQKTFTVATEQIEEKLTKLADAFAKLSQPKIEVTDVVFVEEKPEEIEEDLEDLSNELGEALGRVESQER